MCIHIPERQRERERERSIFHPKDLRAKAVIEVGKNIYFDVTEGQTTQSHKAPMSKVTGIEDVGVVAGFFNQLPFTISLLGKFIAKLLLITS